MARGAPSPAQTASRTAAGSSSAVSLSQYWKAWTKVIERIPPEVTLTSTTTPTTTGPTQVGAPTGGGQGQPGALELRQQVEPADGQHQQREHSARTRREPSRASAKSGSV